ncbi:MAG: hypothetical protein US83_C0013G0002 [Candidatus Falkowbacteria bacterium GW2011_GWC2_38_22]|uniref:Type II secretion system protein n=1 Tax=Candidatus Falkowbacteria bacterium GW2011_GWE1_38_31 TaxID=1618638 RepID=A0A0G0MYL2_9BACT|nr:MAG: hypothetical protein US73_C0006G0063 [Candidatus Falkowbacteria bacterium GW2011_GWF2_38_1205]KKQ60712.1 MAG: hypothetical protein US83_C0013G0002 [Candidatus Falkowbacteria bacterium GW2011_GWC2_38_22]KKQ63269.1 MAG: hypothetical protein US84_C0007G0011 [Candidatus Falkowbacteria bacterium GW2011_GWF1_38_22]KKQ65613.1 MAG: hypothetical protein US87_C0006G0063 [Candidatus Falkowbacteria bacterium GW2011_GWE2_38_254]KKQ70001.1 MAG: hypothetical protein US91_C0007G0011 [Candidatus Falkowb
MKKSIIQGFTLIELLIVIAVMAILTTVVFVALNPLARFQDARNSTRWSDVNAIMAAIKLNQIDHGGTYIDTIDALDSTTVGNYYQIGTALSGCDISCFCAAEDCAGTDLLLESACIDLTNLVETGYLPSVPFDPSDKDASSEGTRYYLSKDEFGRITIGSCGEEAGLGNQAPDIVITR